ncbi:hypothetical protein PLESTB_000948400 [Pleodorina starrii]|uniref:Uncharacterized protein n=1 Tax=Pleodorina starrii TaxID=330485 RepID=A0A9W6BMZ9_9CHLO|nr:hypothetical protein PLESTM_001150600 [Pleodorina starrii]GLC55142.1 hypothetical protein PLESTB_000948400 [Pleodorina starrii]GLC71104.1 hypothetical protein PLESTF_001075000 [Pleodorina starrii]
MALGTVPTPAAGMRTVVASSLACGQSGKAGPWLARPDTPCRRLQYLPAALLVHPLHGHVPTSILQGVSDLASHGPAFPLCPRANLEAATVLMPAAGVGIKWINIPVSDWHAYTDYSVQGRTFGEEAWATRLEPELAAELHLLSRAASTTRNRYRAEFCLVWHLEAQHQADGAAG